MTTTKEENKAEEEAQEQDTKQEEEDETGEHAEKVWVGKTWQDVFEYSAIRFDYKAQDKMSGCELRQRQHMTRRA